MGTPHFGYKGMFTSMAAYKQHVSFGFWRGRELKDPNGIFSGIGKTEMAMLRIEKLSDLPSQRVLVSLLREAMKLNDAAEKEPRSAKKKAAKKSASSIAAPDDLVAALARKKRARATFDGFSYTNRKEYVEWITEAKREATRASRIAKAVEWMSEGKPRNWKYMKEWR